MTDFSCNFCVNILSSHSFYCYANPSPLTFSFVRQGYRNRSGGPNRSHCRINAFASYDGHVRYTNANSTRGRHVVTAKRHFRGTFFLSSDRWNPSKFGHPHNWSKSSKSSVLTIKLAWRADRRDRLDRWARQKCTESVAWPFCVIHWYLKCPISTCTETWPC